MTRLSVSFWALCLAGLVAGASGCKQGEGEPCQITDDCEDGLTCTPATGLCSPTTRDDQASGDDTTTDDSTTTGDGDGDATTGDGDATTGDGDGDATTGDGDGDATTGDGDGDMTGGPDAGMADDGTVIDSGW